MPSFFILYLLCSFDRKALYSIGRVLLAPVVNLKRTVNGGRNCYLIDITNDFLAFLGTLYSCFKLGPQEFEPQPLIKKSIAK